MNPELLEQVLACKGLPSIPAVGLKVIELTKNDRTSMRDLADVIQHDQALAAKVLRTVNSSLFGLRSRCSSINQAIVLLGMATVKTLALGFTLVAAIKNCEAEGFDLEEYWRHGLFTGIAGRAIAARAGLANPEEAFLGGLLQDMGMLALYQTLGTPYLAVIADAMGEGGDHRRVAKLEMDALETQHADIGAMLASRWKLPQTLVMPIKYHERATAAPIEHTGVCRAVGLGNIAADVLTSNEPAQHLRRFYQRAEQWFALTPMQADDVLKAIAGQTREVAKLLSVKTASIGDTEAVLTRARESLARVQIVSKGGDDDDDRGPGLHPQLLDDLTGVANRFRVDQALVAGFEQTRHGVGPFAVAIFEVDDYPGIVDKHGQDAGDTVLIAVAGRLERAFAEGIALVGRFSENRFAVVMPKMDRPAAVKLCEAVRSAVAFEPLPLIAAKPGAPQELSVTCSVGVASFDQKSIGRFEDVQALTAVIEQAVKAAQNAGRNTVRVYAPAA